MEEIVRWTNYNSGFLSLSIFFATIFLGWVSGLFSAILKKPKLQIRQIEKMSFFTFYYTGKKYRHDQTAEEFELHKTAFAVYLSISNIGNTPTSIDKIYLGYKKNTSKNRIFNSMVWLTHFHVFDSFRLEFEDAVMIIPTLKAGGNRILEPDKDDYLEIGRYINGVAYFEQDDAWGNFNPKTIDDKTKVELKIVDIYGRNYSFKTILKYKSLDEAKKLNPMFGATWDNVKKAEK